MYRGDINPLYIVYIVYIVYIGKQCFLKRGESNSGTGQSPGHASRGQLITAVMRRMMVRMVRRTRARAAIGKLIIASRLRILSHSG